MAESLHTLVKNGVISQKLLTKLEDAWITTPDELYARILSYEFSEKENIRESISRELGIDSSNISEFKKHVEPYVSPDTLKAQKPREYHFGYRK